MTTAEQWQRAKEVLDEALDMDTEARPAFIQKACGGDHELLSEVETLLRLDEETELSGFIDRPMFTLHKGEAEPSQLGRVVGRYRLVEEIGRGGMGTVYLAERADEEVEHRVALKILKRGLDTDEIIDRFRRERQIVARLNHPHIANFLDAGTTDDGLPYFVLEHVEGRPIDRYCDEEDLDVEERLKLFSTVCDAVQFAHQNLVVHRDLKPGNILVTKDGNPKLLDFGIAKILSSDGGPGDVTRAHMRFFTRDFASPEQIRNLPITTATDVYSLGVLLYALLAGERPFHKDTTGEERTDTLPKLPSHVAPPELRETLSGDLDHIVLQALHPDPERRYGSVEQLADDIRRYLEGLPVKASPDSPLYRANKFIRRHRLAVTTATGFVVLLLVFAVVTSVLLNRAIRERERAETAQTSAETAADLMAEIIQGADPDQSPGEELTVKQALNEGLPKVLEEEKDLDPQIKAWLLDRVGSMQLRLGDPKGAEKHFQQAMEIREDHGESSLETQAQSLLHLASASRQLKALPNAEARLKGALAIYEEILPPEDPRYRQVMHDLAVLLEETNQLDEAERIHRDLLALNRRLDGPRSVSVANSLHSLGAVLRRQERYQEAVTHLTEALELRRQHQGTNVRAARTLNVLAATLEDMGDLEGARENYQKSLEMREQLYPDGHRDTVYVLNNLGLLALQRQDLGEAEARLREALEMIDELGGSQSWLRPWIVHNLAEVLAHRGSWDEAEGLARQAVESMKEQDQPVPRERLADVESVLGFVLTAQGEYPEAEASLQRAYPVLLDELGGDHRYTLKALDHLVALYDAWGRPERAELYRQIRDGSAGGGVPDVPGIEPPESMTAPFELDLL